MLGNTTGLDPAAEIDIGKRTISTPYFQNNNKEIGEGRVVFMAHQAL